MVFGTLSYCNIHMNIGPNEVGLLAFQCILAILFTLVLCYPLLGPHLLANIYHTCLPDESHKAWVVHFGSLSLAVAYTGYAQV